MKNSRSILLASLALLLLAAPQVRADAQPPVPFSYRVKVPAGSASCSEHAATIASAFAAGTRANQVVGTCEARQTFVDQNQQYALDIVVVKYLSNSELTPQRTIFGGNAFLGNSDATAGVFKSYAECLTQLGTQQATFIRETGITPLTAYCSASAQESYPGFSLTFESFGELKNRLYAYASDSAAYGDDHSQFTQATIIAITSAGGRVVWSDSDRAFYYNNTYVNIGAENLGLFSVSTQCTSQLGQANAIFTAAGWTGITAYCEAFSAVGGQNDSVLMVIGAGQNEISDLTSGRYDTFEECSGDLPRVLQNATSSGRNVLGGVCSPSGSGASGFDAHVFSAL